MYVNLQNEHFITGMMYSMSTKPAGNVRWGFCTRSGFIYKPCMRTAPMNTLWGLTVRSSSKPTTNMLANSWHPSDKQWGPSSAQPVSTKSPSSSETRLALIQLSVCSALLFPRGYSQLPAAFSSICSSNFLYLLLGYFFFITEMSICWKSNVLTNCLTPASPVQAVY